MLYVFKFLLCICVFIFAIGFIFVLVCAIVLMIVHFRCSFLQCVISNSTFFNFFSELLESLRNRNATTVLAMAWLGDASVDVINFRAECNDSNSFGAEEAEVKI